MGSNNRNAARHDSDRPSVKGWNTLKKLRSLHYLIYDLDEEGYLGLCLECDLCRMGDGVFGVIEDLTSAVEKHLASALKNGGDHALEYFLTPSFEGNWKDFATAKELLGMNKDFKVCGRILRDVLIEAGVIKTVSPEKSKNEKSKPRKEK